MATKKKSPPPPEMNRLQRINHLTRLNAPVNLVVNECRNFFEATVNIDEEDGSNGGRISAWRTDVAAALWALATRLSAVTRENDTLQRRLRRDKRRPGSKPAPELLKKEPAPQQAGPNGS